MSVMDCIECLIIKQKDQMTVCLEILQDDLSQAHNRILYPMLGAVKNIKRDKLFGIP